MGADRNQNSTSAIIFSSIPKSGTFTLYTTKVIGFYRVIRRRTPGKLVRQEQRSDPMVEDGAVDRVIEALTKDLQERGGIDMNECFTCGTFSLAKKGAFCG